MVLRLGGGKGYACRIFGVENEFLRLDTCTDYLLIDIGYLNGGMDALYYYADDLKARIIVFYTLGELFFEALRERGAAWRPLSQRDATRTRRL